MKERETGQQNQRDGSRKFTVKYKTPLSVLFLLFLSLVQMLKEKSRIQNLQGSEAPSGKRNETENRKHDLKPQSTTRDGADSPESSSSSYLMYVMTLQGVEGVHASNSHRFDDFQRHWSILCQPAEDDDQSHEQLHFHKCPGQKNPKGSTGGYGLSMAFVDCFDWALEHHREWHSQHNSNLNDDDSIPYVFLEDDARLYDSNFCRSEYRNQLWQSLPATNATLLMLGGHGMQFHNSSDPIARAYRENYYDETLIPQVPKFVKPYRGFGSYGFALLNTPSVQYVRQRLIKMLNRTFTREGMRGFKAIDQQFHKMPIYGNLQTYMTFPWVVYHEGGLRSNTKGKVRGEFGDGSKQYRWVKGLTGSFQNCTEIADRRSILSMSKAEAENNDLAGGTIDISCHTINYIIPKSFAVSNSTPVNVERILTAVISSNGNAGRRQGIRSTWGGEDVIFLVAGSWTDDVASEFYQYRDLVWLNISETAMPTLSGLQVAAFLTLAETKFDIAYSYILKVTDHSYADLFRIRSRLISSPTSLSSSIAMWGSNCGTGVRSSHIGVPETEYSDYFFPEYCKGQGYVLSKEFVQCAVSQIAKARIVSFDDAYVGLLGERCGLQHSQFLSDANFEEEKGLLPMIRHHLTTNAAMKEFHSQVLQSIRSQ